MLTCGSASRWPHEMVFWLVLDWARLGLPPGTLVVVVELYLGLYKYHGIVAVVAC